MTNKKAIELLDNLNNHRSDYDEAIRMAIDALKAEDVVKVVRCKDCKHWQDGEFSSYCICDGFTHSDDYCSYGERKEP